MSADQPADGGLLASARRLGSSLLGLLHTRIELIGLELQEEKARVIDLLIWLTVALGLGLAAILVAIGVLALALWRSAGYAGLIGLVVALCAAAIGVFVYLRRRVLRGPGPFAATAAEFRKDLDSLRDPP